MSNTFDNIHVSFTERLTLRNDYFYHQSHLHGIKHTFRVMTHCLVLGKVLQIERESKLAFCSAFIHDMARKHDGKCHEHGTWAAAMKLPQFAPFFLSLGITEADLEEIRTAVMWHSVPHEIKHGHPFRRTVSLVKDADALDRIRLGEGDLDPDYLGFPESKELVQYAEGLYYETDNEQQMTISGYLPVAINLLKRQKRLPGGASTTSREIS